MSIPEGPMARRFNRVRLEYIWHTVKKGPTEVGYAYFRARRRRRNLADDEPTLSESDQLALSGAFDFDDATLTANRELVERYRRSESHDIHTVQWFLPFFKHVYFGGTHTLLRFADHFARLHGVENRFHCYDVGGDRVPEMARKIADAFPALGGSTFTSASDTAPADLPAADAAIATLWSSAYPLLKMDAARAKFYFVQDFEPQFYPAGAASALVEQTYRFGLPGIVNTPGLADAYREYGNPAVSFVPAVDTHRYHPPVEPRPDDAPVRVFFYARPSTPRNAFGLGLAALAKVKERFGERVEIVCAGEHWNPGQYGQADRIHNLGVLGSLEEVAALYRSCDVGLVFMLTKHPSYQPLEFMASGVATVSNTNPSTAWLLHDGDNCLLTPPAPTPVAERLGRLIEDADLRRRIAAAGLREIEKFEWEGQIDRVWRAMCLADPEFALEPDASRVRVESARSA